jgi:adenine-specific DNA-methyltransferase
MGSRNKNYTHKKLMGKVYTPTYIVQKILDLVGFYHHYENKTILDPACGDGRFLICVAQHIISNYPKEELPARLQNIYGWDLDPEAIENCRHNLNELVKDLQIEVEWNLQTIDTLEQINSEMTFDYIVGNPPYIRIQHLPKLQRDLLRRNFYFCKSGSTDLFIAFFEVAASILSESGICGFITPNTYITSETGRTLRAYFEAEQNLIHITNFGPVMIFDDTSTYSLITVFGKSPRSDFKYEKYDENLECTERYIEFAELDNNNVWHLSTTETDPYAGIKLGDICDISIGLSTLADDIFIVNRMENAGDLSVVMNQFGEIIPIEKSILKPIVKGSKLKSEIDPIQEHIIFPYWKDEVTQKNKIIPEERLSKLYPHTYRYLVSHKEMLESRDNGKTNPVAWYAFGRSQSLDSSFGKKIIFSPINDRPNFILYDNPDCTVYSGYFIKYDGDYDFLLKHLNSERMNGYIQLAGRDYQGGYKGYNKRVVENFRIPENEIVEDTSDLLLWDIE